MPQAHPLAEQVSDSTAGNFRKLRIIVQTQSIPRKRYSWTFFLSALGISLYVDQHFPASMSMEQIARVTYMIASSWRTSGNRFDQCCFVVVCANSGGAELCGLIRRRTPRRLKSEVAASSGRYTIRHYNPALNTSLPIVDHSKTALRNKLSHVSPHNKRLSDIFPRSWPTHYFVPSCRCFYSSHKPEATALQTSSMFGYSAHIHYQLEQRGHILTGSGVVLAIQRS